MNVLITGATGFIGGHLAQCLASEGHDVTAIVRDGVMDAEVDVVNGDLRGLSTVERAMVYAEPDAVFHLAAQAIVPHARRDPWGTFEDNVRGTYNLLEAFRRHGRADATCVVASSDKAYGELDRGMAALKGTCGNESYDESDPLAGRGPYDCSKSCVDLIAQSYAIEYGLRIAVVRAGNVYGPGDTHSTRVVPSIVEDILAVRPISITSDGRPVRDFLYVSDAVRAYRAVQRYLRDLTSDQVLRDAEPRVHRAFNFSGGEAVSVMQLADMALVAADQLGLADSGRPVVLGKRTGEIGYQALDTSLARNVLKWTPAVSLLDGLKLTIAHTAAGRITP